MLTFGMNVLRKAWARKFESAILIGALMVGAAGSWAVFSTNLIYPSVQMIGVQEFQGEGVIDRRLNIYYKFVRRRECQSTQLRWIWRWQEREGHLVQFIVPLDMSMIPISDAGNGQAAEMVVSYAMPTGIDPGDWYFVSKTMDFCGRFSGIFGPTFRQTPDIPVHIELPNNGKQTMRFGQGHLIAPGGAPP